MDRGTGPLTGAKRLAYSADGPGADDVTNANKMRGYLTGARRLFMSPNTSLPADGTVSGINTDFRLRQQAGIGGDPAQLAPPIPTSAAEATANTRHAVNRIVRAPPGGTISMLPGQGEFSFVHRSMPVTGGGGLGPRNFSAPTAVGGGGTGSTSMLGHQWLNSRLREYGSPVTSLHLRSLNLFLAQHYIDLYASEADHHLYYKYNKCSMVVWGPGEDDRDAPGFLGWSNDGLVRVEELENGTSARDSDGYAARSSGAGGSSTPVKKYTMTAAGQEQMRDYVEGAGVFEGAGIWIYCRRVELPPHEVVYTLAAKSTPLGIPVSDAVVRLAVPDIDVAAGHQRRLCVPQFFVGVQSAGNEPDRLEARRCEDEFGGVTYDGFVAHQATILFAPERAANRPAVPLAELKPITDGYKVMTGERFEVILSEDRDGLRAMF